MAVRRSETLLTLATLLGGKPVAEIDWLAVITLANESMTVTQLATKVLGGPDFAETPEDVLTFLTEMRSRNTTRNHALLAQTKEAVTVLGCQGIAPVLLKGSAFLAQQDDAHVGDRMVSDTDMLVRSAELRASVSALQAIGYSIFEDAQTEHAPITLARASDAGMIDLHSRVRGPARLANSEATFKTAMLARQHDVDLRVPDATEQILHLVLHDQFHNRDYWKGRIDLRHLCDIAWIVQSKPAIDWDGLVQRIANPHSLNALASQLIQAERLLSVNIPQHLTSRRRARLQYRRSLLQLDHPVLAVPLTLLTVALSPKHRNRDVVAHDMPFAEREAGRWRGFMKFLKACAPGKL